jgi:hypothetical protein
MPIEQASFLGGAPYLPQDRSSREAVGPGRAVPGSPAGAGLRLPGARLPAGGANPGGRRHSPVQERFPAGDARRQSAYGSCSSRARTDHIVTIAWNRDNRDRGGTNQVKERAAMSIPRSWGLAQGA